MQMIDEILSWLVDGVVPYLVVALVTIIITLIIESLFQRVIWRRVTFFLKRQWLSLFERSIELKMRRSAEVVLRGEGQEEWNEELGTLRREMLEGFRKSLRETESLGETIIRAKGGRDERTKFECRLDSVSGDDMSDRSAKIVLTAETESPYSALADSLLELLAQTETVLDIALHTGSDVRCKPGHASIEVKLKKKPALIKDLTDLVGADIIAQCDGYDIDFSCNHVTFRGDVSAQMASQLRTLITWFY